jgi:hypothetical protein
MAGDGTYKGMMNESQENHGLDWDGVVNPPKEQQDTQVYNTPMTQGQKKPRNKNFCEVEDIAHSSASTSPPSSIIILCMIIQAFMMYPNVSMSHIRAWPQIIAKRACRTHFTSLCTASCALTKYFLLFPCGWPIVFTNVAHDGYMPLTM